MSVTALTRQLLFLLLIAGASLPLGAQTNTGAKAANSQLLAQDIAGAGRLRTQAQRLAKLYQQVAMEVNAAPATRQIMLSSSEIDAEFNRLARYAQKPSVQRSYGRSETVWRELREALKKDQPTPAAVERINQIADELTIHSGKLVMQIEAEADSPVGRLIDLSSRLNMLAQRLARLYLQVQSGNKASGLLIDVEQARKEFAAGLRELDNAPESSVASREAIALAKNQWAFFDAAIGQLGRNNAADNKALLHVATSSERIAQVLDDAGAQYVRDYADNRRSNRP